jgi:hypothetical protein
VTCAHCHTKEWESDEKPPKATARKMIAMMRSINEQQFGGKLAVTCNTCHRGSTVPVPTPEVAAAGWNVRPPAKSDLLVESEDALPKFPKTPAAVQRRVIKGTVERFSGRDEPKSAPFTLSVEGDKIEYKTDLSHPPEARRALVLFALKAPKAEQLRADQWVVDDVVRRRYRETSTPVGNLPEEVSFEDYRDAGGLQLPYRAQWSRADYRVTFTVTEISSE